MTTPASTQTLVTIAELITRLDELSHGQPCNLAFDGDGTLWSGDVSNDVFLSACRSNWFLEGVRLPLLRILSERNLATEGSIGQLLEGLFLGEQQGTIEEQLLFEIMTWCYAGRSIEELSAYAARTLAALGIEGRVRWAYRPLLDWAMGHGHSCWLVSASPWPIVRVVAKRLGFEEAHIIASRPLVSATGLIEPSMLLPVPYGQQKVIQLNAHASSPRLLAAFGDSAFDLELLGTAELAVAVTPKPELEERLDSLARAVVLKL
jgi:phosphatidylglycerophosphatase C